MTDVDREFCIQGSVCKILIFSSTAGIAAFWQDLTCVSGFGKQRRKKISVKSKAENHLCAVYQNELQNHTHTWQERQ